MYKHRLTCISQLFQLPVRKYINTTQLRQLNYILQTVLIILRSLMTENSYEVDESTVTGDVHYINTLIRFE